MEPTSELPTPTEGLGFFDGKAIVEAVGAADDEEVVGDFVGSSGRKFLEFFVDIERTNLGALAESIGRLGGIGRYRGVGEELDGLPFAEDDDVRFTDGVEREGGGYKEEEN